MGENKTKPTDYSVKAYLNSIIDQQKRNDAEIIVDLIGRITKKEPVMWGSSIVGFGSYHYKYASGREGDTPIIALSARKQALVLYGLVFYDEFSNNNKLLSQLGVYKAGKGCLYIKSLHDVDIKILEEMIENAFQDKTKP